MRCRCPVTLINTSSSATLARSVGVAASNWLLSNSDPSTGTASSRLATPLTAKISMIAAANSWRLTGGSIQPPIFRLRVVQAFLGRPSGTLSSSIGFLISECFALWCQIGKRAFRSPEPNRGARIGLRNFVRAFFSIREKERASVGACPLHGGATVRNGSMD